ncbi:class I SAM-dependent methyltransferase, partial [bacterium]|nr:class I SAM-dependent methyltransferase [bacterium]
MNHAETTAHPDALRSAGLPGKADSPALFDRISPRYDLLNHLLSAGLDILWRRRVARELARVPHAAVLDLACGTGDQILAVAKHAPGLRNGLGVDMAQRMLKRGRDKVAGRGLDDRIKLARGDGQELPLAD